MECVSSFASSSMHVSTDSCLRVRRVHSQSFCGERREDDEKPSPDCVLESSHGGGEEGFMVELYVLYHGWCIYH